MPPVTPTRTRAIRLLSPPGARLAERDLDLALGNLLERHRQVVLRARFDERRREVVERALAQLVVVVVDLTRALRRRNHERVARLLHVVEQVVDAWIHHLGFSLPAALSSFVTISSSSSTARSTSSLT